MEFGILHIGIIKIIRKIRKQNSGLWHPYGIDIHDKSSFVFVSSSVWIYFVLLTFFVSFFTLNLVLAVICQVFEPDDSTMVDIQAKLLQINRQAQIYGQEFAKQRVSV